MNIYRNGRILTDVDALDEEFPLEDTQVREEQVRELWFCLSPLEEKKNPITCWLHGEPGTGKTAIAKFVLNQFKSLASFRGVYINCWEKNTVYGVLDRIISDLRILGPERPATSQKLEILQRYLKDNSLVVILDEIDRPAPGERNAIIYNLCNLPKLGLICISKGLSTIFELDERIKSRLNAVRVEFTKYTIQDLQEILARKAEVALVEGTWDEQVLGRIAKLAAGDARIAVQSLKNAAYYAQKEASDRINESHIMRGWHEIREMNRNHLLNHLTYHHSLLYEIIKEKRKVLSNELWNTYLEVCKEAKQKPVSTRTFPVYVNELRDAGLVKVKRAPVKGKVREITLI
jgi:cell division control protein 6